MSEDEKLIEVMAARIYREGMFARSDAAWEKAVRYARAALRAYRAYNGGLMPVEPPLDALNISPEERRELAERARAAVAYPPKPSDTRR